MVAVASTVITAFLSLGDCTAYAGGFAIQQKVKKRQHFLLPIR
jgi:hypothetical protein